MTGKVTNSDIESVGKVASAVGFFCPTNDMKRAKSMFWSRWKMGPVRSADNISCAAIVDLTGLSAIEKWWSEPGFKDWFRNENSYAEDVEHNANLALETLRELMFSDNPSIRMKAASESLKMKVETDKAAAKKEAVEMAIDDKDLARMIEQYTNLKKLK